MNKGYELTARYHCGDRWTTTQTTDEVDTISSVSGGSFTSAYYGLYGERTFEDFKGEFLTRDVEHELFQGLFSPLLWFSSTGRT